MPVLNKLQQQLRNHWYQQSQYGEKEINFFDTHAMDKASAKNQRFFKPDDQSQAHVHSFFGALKTIAKHSVYRAVHDVHRAYVDEQNWLARNQKPDADFQAVQKTNKNQNVDNTKVPLSRVSRTMRSRFHQAIFNRRHDYRRYIDRTYQPRRQQQTKQPSYNAPLGAMMSDFSNKKMQQGAYMYFNEVYPASLTNAASGMHLKNIWSRTFAPTENDIDMLIKIRSQIPDYTHLQSNIEAGHQYLTQHNLYTPTFKDVLQNQKNQMRNQEFQASSKPKSKVVNKFNDPKSRYNLNLKDYQVAEKDYIGYAKAFHNHRTWAAQRNSYVSTPIQSSVKSIAQNKASNMSAVSSAMNSSASSSQSSEKPRSSVSSSVSPQVRAKQVSMVNSAKSAQAKIVKQHQVTSQSQPTNSANSAIAKVKQQASAQVARDNRRISQLAGKVNQLIKVVATLRKPVASQAQVNSTKQSQRASVSSNAHRASSTASSASQSTRSRSTTKKPVKQIGNMLGTTELKAAYPKLSANATGQKRVVKFFINHPGKYPESALKKKLHVSNSTIQACEKKNLLGKIKPTSKVDPNAEQNAQAAPVDYNPATLSKTKPSAKTKPIKSYKDMSKSDKRKYNVVMSDYSTRKWLQNSILPKQKGTAKAKKTQKSIKGFTNVINKNYKGLSNGAQNYVQKLSKNNKVLRHAAFEAHKRLHPSKNSHKSKLDTRYQKNVPKKDRYHFSKAVARLGAVNYFKTKKGMPKKKKISGVHRNAQDLKKQLKTLSSTSKKQFSYIKAHPSYLSKISWTAAKYYRHVDYASAHKAQSQKPSQGAQRNRNQSQSAGIKLGKAAENKVLKSQSTSENADKKSNQRNANSQKRKQQKEQKREASRNRKPSNKVSHGQGISEG